MSLLQRAKKVGKLYQNPVPTEMGGFGMIFKVLPRMIFNRAETEPKQPLGPFPTDASVYAAPPASGLRITWFGHSSLLIEIDGARVLIDPVWEKRASPFQWLGPKRFFAPTLPLESLPPLDAVLVSHDHYDHLGSSTIAALAKLQPQARFATSLGVGKWLRKFGVAATSIAELDWTESVVIGDLKLTAWPSRHFSGRSTRDRFTTLWSSFVLEGPAHRLFYGADSGYWDGFAEIASRYDGFDLILLEIGAFDPMWEVIHLGPDNAVRAFESMGGGALGQRLMPIHWGLFNLALHAWRQPIERLVELAAEHNLPIWSPRPGEPTEVRKGEAMWSSWWQREE
jgi:L-ascorbate metabolism protein UlaG (beta-lactamase superfamily)